MAALAVAISLVLVIATGGMAAAQNRIDLVRPDAPELAARGPYIVGVTTLYFINPGQVDVIRATGISAPVTDRALTVELWYPAAAGTAPGGSYTVMLRDGETEVTLFGQAARDAMPASDETFPLVILSHGYPGNRFLMSPLAESLASRGYVVASIDHTDSTYSDFAAFGSTLVNRPWDQRFVLDSLAAMNGPTGAILDAGRTAVVGYSMGGYGALIFAGAGISEAALELPFVPPGGLLERNMAGSESFAALGDPRVRAVVAFGPWGRNRGFWDAAGLAAIDMPLLLIAGSADDVSEYSAIRQIFEETTGTTRHLLTFENANHNAGAPMPPPEESWSVSQKLGFAPFEHYADAVWDNVRMNNVSAHFVAAFLDLHLKGDTAKSGYLQLVPDAADGVVSRNEAGDPLPDHSYWMGFPDRTAVGLRFETLRK